MFVCVGTRKTTRKCAHVIGMYATTEEEKERLAMDQRQAPFMEKTG